jgi:signal transduction histidine kinase
MVDFPGAWMPKRIALLIAILLLIAPQVHASSPLSVSPDKDAIRIGPDFALLLDHDRAYEIEDVARGPLAAQFTPADRPEPNFIFPRAKIWTRFTLMNPGSETIKRVLTLDLQHALQVDLYLEQEDGTFDRRQRGWLAKYADNERRSQTPHFDIELAPGAEREFYLSLESDWVAILDLNVYEPIYFHTREASLRIKYSVFALIVFGIGIVHLFLFFMDRKRAHIYLSFFAASCGASLYVGSGNAFVDLPASLAFLSRYVYPIFSAASSFWGMLFLREFLKTKTDAPRINVLFNGIIAAACGAMVLAVIVPAASMQLTLVLSGMIIPVQLFATTVALIRGHRPARIYMAGVVTMSLAGAVGLGVVWGLVDSNPQTAATSGLSLIALVMMATVALHVEDKENEKKAQGRLEEANWRLATTEERERQQIAKDLHDGVCQLLTGAKIEVSLIRDSAVEGVDRNQFDSGIKAISQAYEQARKVMYDLAPPVLQNLGLEAALEEALADLESRYQLRTKLSVKGTSPEQDDSLLAVLFRMFRELLMNVVKHASAQSVEVVLSYTSGSVSILVRDDGVGFDPDASRMSEELGSGLGLWSVRDQTNRLGGDFDIRSSPGKGTTVILTLPVAERSTTEGTAT